jgi:hypothetical protein
LKETELAQHFINFFEGHEIFSEVKAYSVIDFVAKKDNLTIGVEVKTSLNFKVIEQAYYNKSYFHQVYVAVPFKQRDFSFKICKDYGIGILLYYPKSERAFVAVEPANVEPKQQVKLHEYNKMSVAGSQHDRMTAFKWTLLKITEYLKDNDGAKLDTVVKNVKHHWHTNATALSCLRKYNRNGVLKDFRIEKGKVYLNEKDTKET